MKISHYCFFLKAAIVIATIISCTLIACQKPVLPKRQIESIEISTSGCLHRCPVIAIHIDSSLTLQYRGGFKAKPQGYYKGHVTEGFWDTLNMKLNDISFQKLDTSKYYPIDGEVAEVIIHWGKHKTHIFKSIDEDPDSVSHVLIGIINSYKHVKLYKLKDTVKFETPFYNPPILKKHTILFPPPIKKRNG